MKLKSFLTLICACALLLIGKTAKAQIYGTQTISGIATGYTRNFNTNLVTPVAINLNTERHLNVTLIGKAVNSNSVFTVTFAKSADGSTNTMETTPSISCSLTCPNTSTAITNIDVDVGGVPWVFVYGQTNALDITTNVQVIISHTFKNGG